jgi:hypothetical protein
MLEAAKKNKIKEGVIRGQLPMIKIFLANLQLFTRTQDGVGP